MTITSTNVPRGVVDSVKVVCVCLVGRYLGFSIIASRYDDDGAIVVRNSETKVADSRRHVIRRKIHCSSMMVMTILVLILSTIHGFSLSRCHADSHRGHYIFQQRILSATSSDQQETTVSTSGLIDTYEHDGWTLSYRYKPASKGFESSSPLLLVHPVGIGLSSWFWEKMFDEWTEGPALYAPDLIGCGVKNGGDAWDPDKRGLFLPLGWVQGCETLLQSRVLQPTGSNKPTLPSASVPPKQQKCIVITQGGLAPVGVVLAARNPDTVSHLVMASPPSWKDMTTPVPEKELARNYDFLRSPIFGPPAFGLLESRWAIEFFSNAFLFEDRCDERWLDLACEEIAVESRPPTMAFNAGLCMARSFQQELETLPQPTFVLSGSGDTRAPQRVEYQQRMRQCTLRTLPGKNVLPWESSRDVCKAVKDFCY
jgi:pimeloyl-ACP methyl ester carboxylesterase